jgi:sigma-B regulation protein RsbU (phosphoserine phosphatase)
MSAGNAYQEIVEHITDGVVLLDREGRCLYANPAALQILKRSASAEITDKNFWDVVPGPVGEKLRQSLDRIVAGDRSIILRNYYSGNHWYEGVANFANGWIILLLRDITERLEAESARKQIEERFQILVNEVSDYAIFMLDVTGRIASWNIGATRLYGYSAEEVLGKDPAAADVPDLVRVCTLPEDLEETVAKGHTNVELWRTRKDGSKFLASISRTALFDELDQPSGFAVITRDITEIYQTNEALRMSEERIRLAMEAGKSGTWEYIFAEKKHISDSRFRSLCGLPAEGVIDVEILIRRIHPEDRTRFVEVVKKAFVTQGSIDFELRTDEKECGVERWIEAHGKVLVDKEGRADRALGVVRDVTDRHRYEEFRKLLPGIIAHDLRQPISAVKLSTETLLKVENLPEMASKLARNNVRTIDRMALMASQILEYTQVQFGGGLPLDRAWTDLGEVGLEIVAEAQISHPTCRILMKVDGDLHGSWDRTRLSEVVQNLLENALEFGPSEGTVEIKMSGEREKVVLKVHNIGSVISPKLLPIVFDPFRWSERSDLRRWAGKSMGLGLFITRGIVLAHGGKIDVNSSIEAGTTFTVSLPRIQSDAIAA